MARGFILVLDGCGVGAAPDADRFGDVGSDTIGHVAEACAAGKGDAEGLRSGPLKVPFLTELGLGEVSRLTTGRVPPGLEHSDEIKGIAAACAEQSFGKDTPSGHWEMAGAPARFDWGYFIGETPCFPKELIDAFVEKGSLPGVLGECHASGTVILDRLGEEHIATGKPIVYTSADSVFQIAAHEETFGLERLYEISEIARALVDKYEIGRVIARPFLGEKTGAFKRTGNRRDYATPPHKPTLLDQLKEQGREVISVGKIADIFAHQGLTQKVKATGNEALFDATLEQAKSALDGSLIFTNFVDFDQEYGHRRNVPGFAGALEHMDRRLPELEAELKPGDLVILTADHGCDPTWEGTDHTREFIPFLMFGPGLQGKSAGLRESFADIGQTMAQHLGISPLDEGEAIALEWAQKA